MAIALLSLLGTILGTGFWLLLLLGLLLAQWRRWIERWDLVVIGAVTLLLVLFVPFLNKVVAAQVTGNSFFLIIILAILTGLAAVVVAIVFRLVYLIISRFV